MANSDSISWQEGYSEGYAEGHWAGRLEAITKVLHLIDDLKEEHLSEPALPVGYFISRLRHKVENLLGGA